MRVCEIQALNVNACDTANGLDVVARIQMQLLWNRRVTSAVNALSDHRLPWVQESELTLEYVMGQ